VSHDPEILLPLPQAVFHIMLALTGGERHGYAIMQEVAARTEGKVRLGPGTLYGSIKRMVEQGLIQEDAGSSLDDERRRYYRLTPFGRRVASAEAARVEALFKQARSAGLIMKRA
jgi:DNA-binding PadR family transcriptional regulator